MSGTVTLDLKSYNELLLASHENEKLRGIIDDKDYECLKLQKAVVNQLLDRSNIRNNTLDQLLNLNNKFSCGIQYNYVDLVKKYFDYELVCKVIEEAKEQADKESEPQF